MMARLIALVTTCIALTLTAGAQVPRLQMQTSHTATVRMIDYDATSALCVSASNDYSIRIWSVSGNDRGPLLRVLTGHQTSVLGAIMNPNNHDNVISWSSDRTVRVWSIESGGHTVVRPQDVPASVDVRGGSNVIAIATVQQEIEFFDATTGASADRSIEIGFDVRTIRFNPSGELLLIAGTKGELVLLHTRTRQSTAINPDTKRPIIGAYWTSNDTWIAVSEGGDVFRGRGEQIERFQRLQTRIRAVSRQSSGSSIAMVTDGGDVVLYDTEAEERRVLRRERDMMSVDAIALLQDGLVVCAAEYSGGLHQLILRAPDGKAPSWRRSAKAAIITAVKFLDGSKDLLVGDNTGSCWYWDTRSGARPIQITAGEFDKIQVIRESPDSQHIILGGFGRQLCGIVNTTSWDVRWLTLSNMRSVRHADYSSEEIVLIVDDATGEILKIDTSGTIHRRWSARAREVHAVTENTFIAVTDAEVRLYHHDSSGALVSVVPSSTGTIVSSAWNRTTRRMTLQYSTGAVYTVVVPSDNAKLQQPVQVVAPSALPVSTALIDQQKRLMSGGVDGTLRVIEAGSSKQHVVRDVCRLYGRPTAMAVSSDGSIVAAGMQDGSVHIISSSSRAITGTLHATPDGWTAAMPAGMYDGDNSAQSSLLVVVGSEVRSLSEMPSMYRIADVFRRACELDAAPSLTMQLAQRDVLAVRPARINFVRRARNVSTLSECMLTYRLQSQGATVRSVTVTEGSRVVYQRRASASGAIPSHVESFRTTLRGGLNQFTIRVSQADGASTFDTISIDHPEVSTRKPLLYTLIIGVNDYGARQTALAYAVEDAQKIEKAITTVNPQSVVTRLLNKDATSARIVTELRSIAAAAQPQDNVVIYYAGHGMSCLHSAQERSYCLLPYARDEDPGMTQEIGIDTLFAEIQKISASGMLVILDACQSGAVAESDGVHRTLTREGESSVAVIASTTKSSRAAESPVVGGGLFTHVISEGLAGRARDSDGDITAFSLANYVAKKLPGLCQQVGVPVQRTVTQLGSTGTGMVLSLQSN